MYFVLPIVYNSTSIIINKLVIIVLLDVRKRGGPEDTGGNLGEILGAVMVGTEAYSPQQSLPNFDRRGRQYGSSVTVRAIS